MSPPDLSILMEHPSLATVKNEVPCLTSATVSLDCQFRYSLCKACTGTSRSMFGPCYASQFGVLSGPGSSVGCSEPSVEGGGTTGCAGVAGKSHSRPASRWPMAQFVPSVLIAGPCAWGGRVIYGNLRSQAGTGGCCKVPWPSRVASPAALPCIQRALLTASPECWRPWPCRCAAPSQPLFISQLMLNMPYSTGPQDSLKGTGI